MVGLWTPVAELRSKEVQILCYCTKAGLSGVFILLEYLFFGQLFYFPFCIWTQISELSPCHIFRQTCYLSLNSFALLAVLRTRYQTKMSLFDILGMRLNNQFSGAQKGRRPATPSTRTCNNEEEKTKKRKKKPLL